jgi:hypothetical protein
LTAQMLRANPNEGKQAAQRTQAAAANQKIHRIIRVFFLQAVKGTSNHAWTGS